MGRRGWAAMLGVGIALAVVPAAPAGAVFTGNSVGCSGSAVITDDGKTYPVNANDRTAKVPRDGTARWQGGLATVTHNHRGEVSIKLGFWDLNVGRWGPSPNGTNQNARQGDKEVPSFMAQVPAGKYKLKGFHRGNEGGCSGYITVEVEGSPFSNAAGIVGVAGTVVSAAGLAVASRARR